MPTSPMTPSQDSQKGGELIGGGELTREVEAVWGGLEAVI